MIAYLQFQAAAPQLLPAGSTIGGVPVGGRSPEDAIDQVRLVYDRPVQLNYRASVILVEPPVLGFQLESDAMLAEARRQSGFNSPLAAFWLSLWRKPDPQPVVVALSARVDQGQLRLFFEQQILPRYDQPALPPLPQPGTPGYQPGTAGWTLDLANAIPMVENTLRSPLDRVLDLPVIASSGGQPLPENLEIQLRQLVGLSGFDGLVSMVIVDPRSGQMLQFSEWNGVPVELPVAFSAASTMKIPIMISVLRRTPEPTPQEVLDLFNEMIVYSRNPPSDALMERIDPVRGPLIVTSDLEALGFKNSFMAGYFYLGAPLLNLYQTPANQRTDVNLDPDVYNQTSPEEIASLLQAVYQCAASGDGLLPETFPGEITQSECRTMVDTLAQNRIGLLIETGVPDGTTVAHKHGWFEETDGLLHAMSDVALVYTPGGDYVLTIFMYHPDQLLFDPANDLVTLLSRAVYNFFNP